MALGIELPTVLLLNTTSLLVGAVVFLHVRKQSHPQKRWSLGLLATAFTLLAVGATIAGETDHLPFAMALWPHLSLLLGTVGYTLMWSGFHILAGAGNWQQDRWMLLLPVAIALLGGFTGFPLNNLPRASVYHGYAILALLCSAYSMLRQNRIDPLPSRPMLACSLVVSAAIYLLNIVNMYLETSVLLNVADAFFFEIVCGFAICLLTISLVNDRTQARLQKMAQTDPLTGAGNRRSFLSRLPTQPQPGAAMLLIDLDHFKRINDQFGHATGDAVLVACAQCIHGLMPQAAVFARYGGEEFVLYLPRVTADEAMDIAEGLRRGLAALVCEDQGQAVPVSASFGVAMAGTQDAQWPTVLHRADQALYAAKAAGRNCVRLHGQPLQAST